MTGEPGLNELLRDLAPRVLAALVRRYGAFDAADDAVQEALVAAAGQWPRDGVPAQPRNWLTTVATRRLIEEFLGQPTTTRNSLLVLAGWLVTALDGLLALLARSR